MNVELTIKGDIERLHLEPDDVLILKLRTDVSDSQLDAIAERARRAFELNGIPNRLIVISEHLDLEVAGR